MIVWAFAVASFGRLPRRGVPFAPFLVAWIVLASGSVSAQDQWAAADSAVRRLPLAHFPNLPDAIARYLANRECRIPQSFETDEPHNVIRGEFFSRAQTAWAVLCSVGHRSRIIVLAGDTLTVGVLRETPDRNALQGLGASGIAYSRYLTVASPDRVMEVVAAADDVPLVDLHDGVEDHFLEKGSVVYYYVNGRWVRLVGGD